jgi:hypothetical protein
VRGSSRSARIGLSRVLALAPLRFLGDRSYALYLWHWPVVVIASQYSERQLPVRANLVLLLGALALSIVSYALYEDPIRRLRWNGGALAFAGAIAVVMVVGAFTLNALAGREARFEAAVAGPMVVQAFPVARTTPVGTPSPTALPAVVAAVRAARRGEPIPRGLVPPVSDLRSEAQPYLPPRGCVPVAASSQSTSRICTVGKTSSPKTLVVIGDSHAQMWMPAVLRLAERDGWRVLPLLRPGCTPDTWVDDRGLAACRPWYRWATGQVRRLQPRVTLVSGAVSGTRGAAAAAAERGMRAMTAAVRAPSGRVLVIGDPPGLRRNPIDCLLSRRASMAYCSAIWPRSRLRPYDRVEAVTRRLGVGFVDTRGWFCFEGTCPTVIGGTITYRDYRHLTVAYALRLSTAFRAAFRAELARSR